MARINTDIVKQIGRRISQARVAAGMSVEFLAEQLRVESVTVSRWQMGQRSPSISTLVQLAQVCGVEAGSLLADGPPPRPAVDEDTAEILALVGQLGQARRKTAIKLLQVLVDEG